MNLTDLQLAKKMVNLSKSAEDRGIEFNISFSKMKQLFRKNKCEITGVEFVMSQDSINYPSIDRLDNDRGYLDDNVVICTRYINGLKGQLSIQNIVDIHKILTKKQLIR